MSRSSDRAVEIQRRYYTETASDYDSMHAHEGDDEDEILRFVYAMLRLVGARSVLDVGAGTGRGVRNIQEAMPELIVRGIEPVAALIEQAVQKNGVPKGTLIQGVGEALPFPDASFDAVYSFGILHHIRHPNRVVREMLRVARKAVFISDSNRFGQGRHWLRLLKLALYKMKLWSLMNRLKTGGKGYLLTSGDGLAYSYSVYDSFDCVTQWADRLILIPSETGKATSWLHPLLNSGGVLVCAIKEK